MHLYLPYTYIIAFDFTKIRSPKIVLTSEIAQGELYKNIPIKYRNPSNSAMQCNFELVKTSFRR